MKLTATREKFLNLVDNMISRNKISHAFLVEVNNYDDDFECVPLLQRLDCNNLEILTIEGADHDFTGMVEEFITLTDLL